MIVTFDVETYYSPHYSLTKMTTAEYILDLQYQTILAAIQEGDGPCETFVGHKDIMHRLSCIRWERAALLAHNTKFDGAVLSWRFGIEPAMYLDTLSMARAATHWNLGKSSLKAVSEYLQLPPKGDEVVRAIGKRLEDFTPVELREYESYCQRDALNCRAIFNRMRSLFQNSELRLIDLILRMFIIPQVKLNPDVLDEYLGELRVAKAQALAKVSYIDPAVFSSNQRFAVLLEEMGVEVPKKISPTTGLEMPALARNDRGFKELLIDDSQSIEVQAVLAARMNAKSTLEETRTQRLLNISRLSWPDASADQRECNGASSDLKNNLAPVPLRYYAARTGRLGGDDHQNWQNFRRLSKIRDAVEAPPGYRIVHRDASQIEARMVAWLARCKKQLDAFADPTRDLYCEFASSVFGKVVTKADKELRFVGGKTPILQCQYGSGPSKFRHTLFIGNGGMSVSVTEEEARRIVYHYRNEYPEIPKLWERASVLLRDVIHMSRGGAGIIAGYPMVDTIAAVKPSYDAVFLPNNLCIPYPNIRRQRDPASGGMEMYYDDPYGGTVKIYGAKCVENISQALSRIVVTDIAVRVYNDTKRHPFLSTHDSLDYCVPESEVEWYNQRLEHEFSIRPSWAIDLPLASEGGWGKTLLAAERGDNL